MRKQGILAAVAALLGSATLLAAPAHAQAYASVTGGHTVPQDIELDMDTNRLRTPMDDGYHAGAAAGYKFGWLRVELEASFARASVNQLQAARNNRTGPARPIAYRMDGGTYYRSERAVYLNALVDVPLSQHVALTGGGGAGYGDVFQRAKVGEDCAERFAVRVVDDGVAKRRDNPATGGKCNDQGNGSNAGFTWQLIAGMRIKPTPTSRWALSPTLRYVRHQDVEVAGKSNPTNETRHTQSLALDSWRSALSLSYSF